MSSYAQLKQMALKKAEEEQAALNRERERKEREAAAKIAAREAQEREQKERERKILVQRMARQKEEEARERLRKEHAASLRNESALEKDTASKSKTAFSSSRVEATKDKSKPRKASGSTQKVDLSHHLSASSGQESASRRKRKVDEDDFVGNRLDKGSDKWSARTSASTSASAPKRKAVPLTREEKQAMRRAREFGSIPRLPPIGRLDAGSGSSSRSSPGISNSERPSANRPSARSQIARDNGLVALGTKKRDQRTIDEIERDLRKLKEAKGDARGSGLSQAELEREAALLRRQKAMEEKRRSDQQARDLAASKHAGENGHASDEQDDLFGSDDESTRRPQRKVAPPKAADRSERNHSDSPGPSCRAAANRDAAAQRAKEQRPPSRREPDGINPADFLPGAPLRPEAMARLKQKAKPKSDMDRQHRSPDSDASSKPNRPSSAAKQAALASAPKESPPAAPARRETARDRFIREQEEKRKKLAASSASKGARSSRSPDEYESEEKDEEDAYESDGIDDDDAGGQSYRDEIWKIFGKDRKKYASRVVDSDDDMEADAESVLREELRSSRQAREEDLREEQLEKQREREKLLRKQALKKSGVR